VHRRELLRRLGALGLATPVAATFATAAAPNAAARLLVPHDFQASVGTLTIGTETDIEGFDPGHESALASTRVNNCLLEGLVGYAPGSTRLVPRLATSVPTLENGGISEDGLTYTYRLRRGVTFHDGTPLNAEAVKISYQRLYDQNFARYDATNTSGFFLTGLTAVDTLDEHTIRFSLGEANAAFMELSNIYAGKVLSPKQVHEQPVEAWNAAAAGTGPFTVEMWEPGVKVELARNERYWGRLPPIERLIFRPIPNPEERVAALLAGEVDLIVAAPPDAIDTVRDDAGVTDRIGPSLHSWFVQLNTQAPPFDDVKVRRAVNVAIDKDALTREVLHGTAAPATQPMPAASWAHDRDIAGYPFDPAQARTLLADAGYAEGFATVMIAPESGPGMLDPVGICARIARDLRRVGVSIDVQTAKWGSYLGSWSRGLNEQVTMACQAIVGGDPYVATFLLGGGYTPSAGGWNVGYYANGEADKLLSDALLTTDRPQRRQLYTRAWEMIVEDAPWIFVCNDLQPVAFADRVQGYRTNPAYVIDFTTISLNE
jgi:peptide/nickel transport system substrate-binding protein